MSATSTHYQNPYGTFDLQRYPGRRQDPLQPWCAADTLLLTEAHTLAVPGERILVVNDDQGALCTALTPASLWTDSAMAVLAIQGNLARNDQRPVQVRWSTEQPTDNASLVVMRVPKQLAYFEYQLKELARLMPAGTRVLAAGMDKHLSRRTAQIMEQIIGPTDRHPGQRKARLFSASCPGPVHGPGSALAQGVDEGGYYCEELQSPMSALPNVFSRDSLDIGSRFLLQHLQQIAPVETVLDLACGNGVLGLAALRGAVASNLVMCDESAMAIASTRDNARRLFPQHADAIHYHHGDGLLEYQGPQPGLILCNPPFHSNHAVDEFAGRRLISQCAGQLLPGGRLCLVANRHLDYGPVLARAFKRVNRLASNSKFTLWSAALAPQAKTA